MTSECVWRVRLLAVMMAAFVGSTTITRAQTVAQFETWKKDSTTRRPTTACGNLRSLTGFDVSVDTATMVPAQGRTPEFCRAEGQILPEVRFEVSLPSEWNGRFYMFGNGGFAGEALAAPGRIDRRDAALRSGFAVAQTNTGHDSTREPLASFARQPQKLIDFGYRAVHVTTTAAKTIIGTYYDGPPTRSYFAGCSTGGRQGLVSAQRFPEDFDGILVGAPVLDFSGIMVQFAKAQRALSEAPLSTAKVQYLSDFVHGKCDALDGVADGVIEDPLRCSLNLAKDVPRCAAGEAGGACLTPGELKSLEAFSTDVTSRGASVFPAFPIGTGILAPSISAPGGSLDHWIGRPGQQAASLRFTENFFKDMAAPGMELDWRAFDPDRDMHTLRTTNTIVNATDPDLNRFRARGGKILMYHGWGEPQINPLLIIGYYQKVRDASGPATQDFLRLFMMPGVLHCGGGVGPDLADMMTPLVNWVERNVAPDRIVAARQSGGKVMRTRPLCVYPEVAKYTGTGSTDEAANFVCGNP